MPQRKTPLITGEFYHVFNRGIAGLPTFTSVRDYRRFFGTINYYVNENTALSYSKFCILSVMERTAILTQLAKRKRFLVELVSFCLMPNHFHFVIRQRKEDGIRRFLGNITNSYTKFHNLSHQRLQGPLFQGRFRAERIETEEQLIHVVRYVHLNPYTSYVIKRLSDLERYPHSSFGVYLKHMVNPFVVQDSVMAHFPNIEVFKKFTYDQSDYQRELKYIGHLLLGEN